MANRRVAVDLELETAAANRSAAELGVTMRGTKAAIEDLGDEADDAGRDMDQLAANTDLAKRQVDDLGDEALGTAAALTVLDARIATTKLSVRQLGQEFARTGDIIDSQALGKERSLLSKLERLRKELTPPDPPDPGGGVSGLAMPGRMQLIGGAVAVLLTPNPLTATLGALIAGIVSGAIGTGGVLGGVLMAARDSKVQAAAKALGSSIADEFFRGGDVFVSPTLQSMTILDKAFKDMQVPEAFAKMAPLVTLIAEGFGDLGRNIMPGLNKAFDRMGPFASVAADGMGDLGSALGIFMDETTKSEGAVQGLDLAFKILNGTIVLLGVGLHTLADGFSFGLNVAEGIFGSMPMIGPLIDSIRYNMAAGGPVAEEFGGALGDVGTSADTSTEKLKAMNDVLDSLVATADKLIPAYFSMEELQDRAANSTARLIEQIKEQRKEGVAGAGSLDRNTQAGRDNAEMVRDLTDMYGDMIIKTAEAGGNTDVLKQKLRDALLQMGFSKTEVERYISALELIPAEKITAIRAENAQALATIQETDRELNRLYDRTITLTATFRAGERASSFVPPAPSSPSRPGAGEGRRAGGGPVSAFGAYVVGERQPEVLQMGSMNGYVFPSIQAWQAAAGGAAASSNVTNVQVIGRPDQTSQEIAAKVIREMNWKQGA